MATRWTSMRTRERVIKVHFHESRGRDGFILILARANAKSRSPLSLLMNPSISCRMPRERKRERGEELNLGLAFHARRAVSASSASNAFHASLPGHLSRARDGNYPAKLIFNAHPESLNSCFEDLNRVKEIIWLFGIMDILFPSWVSDTIKNILDGR